MSALPTRRSVLAGAAGTLTAAGLVTAPSSASASPTAAAPAGGRRLTNLAHLRWLLDDVPLAVSSTHTTIDIAQRPTGRAPWTYANATSDGGFDRVGGGSLDPATGHWSQGAYNADDIARAAVVFARAARAGVDGQSADDALELLRTLTWLQDVDGPHAGDVVLWLQPDGELNLTPTPPDSPNPSDSAESYWLARTVWAIGEGYALFVGRDVRVARFLKRRMSLCLDALERASLSRYGTWLVADDVRVPGWLVTGGADATAEACLGLAAYLEADPYATRVRRALTRYTKGVAAMRSGATGTWPYGAVLPTVTSQSFWHAWGGEAPAALGAAARVLGDATARAALLSDAGTFTPQVLTSGGPHNAWAPLPAEAQIAYGAEGRVAGLLAAADLTGSRGFLTLAGLAGGWFFGANTSGRPVYDPATGVTNDGVETDGRVNVNSGAESTIHGQLAMLALDAHPVAAALAASVTGYAFHGLTVVEAESGTLAGGAAVVTPPSAWTGAANWSGGAYVDVPAGGTVGVTLPGPVGDDQWLLQPVVDRRPGDLGRSRYWAVDAAGRRTLVGTLPNGGLRRTGVVPADGLLRPFPLPRPLPAGTVSVLVDTTGDLRLDALVLLPVVSTVTYARGSGTPAVLYANATTDPASCGAVAPGSGWTWTAGGVRRGAVAGVPGGTVTVTAGGFAVTT
ncbi:hypothetical protein [Lapillicoccus jejuensis]|uniref:Uncharacterized protein n=1 Tax=Lapillicoccus jejuensis TaxID=402171 RepID=A0A542E1B0_9MICO|nr:hypothetical protein [Lapillicoccus jejuensis]TQJ08994.1 hypothetical protein FB458_2096 [Lapillicoccus jejuensis]